MARYITFNGPSPTTAAQAKIATGTAIRTQLQVATPSTRGLSVVEWGISFDGSAAATPIEVELLQTDVAATALTAHVAAGVPMFGSDNYLTSSMTLGTGATGYWVTGMAEGTITVVRMFDCQLIAPSAGYVKQFPLGERPLVAISKFLRIRVTAGASVGCICYIIFDEN
jgi:hypothetical protein